jgi:hypothetical protein
MLGGKKQSAKRANDKYKKEREIFFKKLKANKLLDSLINFLKKKQEEKLNNINANINTQEFKIFIEDNNLKQNLIEILKMEKNRNVLSRIFRDSNSEISEGKICYNLKLLEEFKAKAKYLKYKNKYLTLKYESMYGQKLNATISNSENFYTNNI